MNPQISFGEDVVSRIAFANKAEDNRKLLQTRLVETLNQSTAEFCVAANVRMEQIVDAVVVGNTAMHHFLCALPVSQLGAAPYVPAVSEALDVPRQRAGPGDCPGRLGASAGQYCRLCGRRPRLGAFDHPVLRP